MSTRKNRGVRCDRTKLDAALAASSLVKKTQIAVAEAIADAEQLDSVPKDLVSKLFREHPVDPQTVERVASVLNVSATSLYKNADAIDKDSTTTHAADSSNDGHTLPRLVWLTLLSCAIIVSVLVTLHWQRNGETDCVSLASPLSTTQQSAFTIVIGRLAGDQGNQAQHMLAATLTGDNRLNANTQIYTSCFSRQLNAAVPFADQIERTHQAAKHELETYRADLIVWGERYDNRLTLRFTSHSAEFAQHNLSYMGKPILANEKDFALNFRMDDESVLSGDLQTTILSLISAKTPDAKALKASLLDSYNYTGSWLKEAVLSDTNLLKRISPQSDPKLYELTLTQLCYQRRLLGDIESSINQYQQAQQACQKALELSSESHSPMQWASLKGNLAVLDIRLHLYADTLEERVTILERARQSFSRVEPVFQRHASPAELSTFYQNYSATFIRLAEFQPDDSEQHLMTAMSLLQRSLQASSANANPLYYAQRLQNLCVIEYRLGGAKQEPELLKAAIRDCSQAKSLLQVSEHPHIVAMIQNNLAISHAILAEVNASPALSREALTQFNQAQQIFTVDAFEVNWAQVELNKAELTCKLALMEKTHERLHEATALAEAAQLVFIKHQIGGYQRYVEGLLDKIASCSSTDLERCKCSE